MVSRIKIIIAAVMALTLATPGIQAMSMLRAGRAALANAYRRAYATVAPTTKRHISSSPAVEAMRAQHTQRLVQGAEAANARLQAEAEARLSEQAAKGKQVIKRGLAVIGAGTVGYIAYVNSVDDAQESNKKTKGLGEILKGQAKGLFKAAPKPAPQPAQKKIVLVDFATSTKSIDIKKAPSFFETGKIVAAAIKEKKPAMIIAGAIKASRDAGLNAVATKIDALRPTIPYLRDQLTGLQKLFKKEQELVISGKHESSLIEDLSELTNEILKATPQQKHMETAMLLNNIWSTLALQKQEEMQNTAALIEQLDLQARTFRANLRATLVQPSSEATEKQEKILEGNITELEELNKQLSNHYQFIQREQQRMASQAILLSKPFFQQR